jgi:hypothetical protein
MAHPPGAVSTPAISSCAANGRWVAERTLASITSYRRCGRDYERLAATIHWAVITPHGRRLAEPAHFSNTHLAQVRDGGNHHGRSAGATALT